MPKSNWKQTEREIVRLAGGERTGPQGRHLPDGTEATYPLSLEVKHRENIPQWLIDAVDQSETEAYTNGFLPVVILHPKGWGYTDSIVLCRYGKLLKWIENNKLGAAHPVTNAEI